MNLEAEDRWLVLLRRSRKTARVLKQKHVWERGSKERSIDVYSSVDCPIQHPKTVVADCTPPCSRDKRVSRCPRSACRSVPQEGDFDCYRKRESSSQNDKPCTSRAMIEQLDQNHTISSKPSNVRM